MTLFKTMEKAEAQQDFPIAKAARLSGLNRTMVDYLCRQGILVPSLPKHRGRGRQRRYSFGDVVMLRVIAKLLDNGISVMRLKQALVALRKHHSQITPTSLPGSYLVTDGRQVFLKHDEATLETLDEAGQMSFAFVIELNTVRLAVMKEAEMVASGRLG